MSLQYNCFYSVDPTKIVDLILPSLFKDRLSFSKEKQLKLLSAGGLRRGE